MCWVLLLALQMKKMELMEFKQLAQDYIESISGGQYLNLDLSDSKAYIFFAVAFGLSAKERTVGGIFYLKC